MHGDGGVRARGREDETFHKNENRTYECAMIRCPIILRSVRITKIKSRGNPMIQLQNKCANDCLSWLRVIRWQVVSW